MKTLIVDDSIVFRSGITQALSKEIDIDVYKAVSNGKIAVDFLKNQNDIDLITLDMEMPIMNGLETIKEIRKFNKNVIIIVFSATTVRGAEATIDALTHGANDFVAKVEGAGSIEESIEMIRNELVPKIRAFSFQKGEKQREVETVFEKTERLDISHSPLSDVINVDTALGLIEKLPKMILIGSSTGGPDALLVILSKIKKPLEYPVFIVQHMPPIFTKKLAEVLNIKSALNVKEAENYEVAKAGYCYIAPGDYHMTVHEHKGEMVIKLNKDEKVCSVRPSVDVLFESCANSFEGPFLSFVLTGMGRDGTSGSIALNRKKNYLFIQDKESSAVWGMGGSIDKENIGAKALKLEDIGTLLSKLGNN
jgi:two-component system chemotaxis response regulator CheB